MQGLAISVSRFSALGARAIPSDLEKVSVVAVRSGGGRKGIVLVVLHRTDFDVADEVWENGYACNNDDNCNCADDEISHVSS